MRLRLYGGISDDFLGQLLHQLLRKCNNALEIGLRSRLRPLDSGGIRQFQALDLKYLGLGVDYENDYD